MCAGNVDRSDGSTDPAKKSRIEPDPLAGFAIERPPDWIVRAASERLPFEPWEPSSDGDDGGLNPVNPANSAPSGWIPWALAGAILIGAAGVAGRLRARA